jgi:hypothetical protein
VKKFVAIAAQIYRNKLVAVSASNGRSLSNVDGLTFEAITDFLFDLRHKKQKDEVFICYAFQTENEFLFSQLPDSLKDKLFQSHSVREKIDDLNNEIDEQDYQLFNLDKTDENYELFDFERYVNRLSLKELVDVNYNGYDIRLISGKLLTLNKGGKRFILFDVYGFFRTPLQKAVKDWQGKNIEKLDRKNQDLIEGLECQQLGAYARFEANHIADLMTALNESLIANNINLTKFHGVTCVSGWLLAKSKAREQYYNYRYRRQCSGELYEAVNQAYYGGRIEQLKLGTFDTSSNCERVNVYDINSAYATAGTLLPIMHSKPVFSNEWKDETFSLWHIKYDFSSIDSCIGLLPNRDVGSAIKYKLRGKGYFWQPEVKYLIDHYPHCVQVDYGFYLPYEKADFTKSIADLYDLRLELQLQGHPLEKVLKLALAAIYGKFCQRDGRAYYYNLFYAGFITSFTRSKMLEAVKGYERTIICFLTDAIHTSANLPVICTDKLGDWKKSEYTKAQYLDAGIYRLYDSCGNLVKEKTKGFRTFDFEKALTEFQDSKSYTAFAEYFVGHNLHSFMPMRYRNYLDLQAEEKQASPLESKMRQYHSLGIDLTKDFCESSVIDKFSGRESAPYRMQYFRESDAAKDSLTAGKI